MVSPDLPHLSAACAAAFLAGAINSVAGGGTLISFPTLLWLGLPSITANATSTVAIWPGSLGSLWGFRRELTQTHPPLRNSLAGVSLLGGAIGALLLRWTPPSVFDRLVPFLILFATILFTVQGPLRSRLLAGKLEAGGIARHSGRWLAGAMFFQLLVAIYGGYFGAGISILGLATLSILGMTDILEMNALTSLFSLCINGVAATLFICAKMVYWPFVLAMGVAAMIGGYGAAGLARRVGRTIVRRFVIVVGFSISLALLIKNY
jgi:uncharacterized protein